MNFWIVITNLQGGGAERSMLNIASGLVQRGNRVKLILLEDRIDHALPKGVEPLLAAGEGRVISKGWIGKRVAAWRLRRLIRDRLAGEHPDAIISTLPFTDEVVRLAGLHNVWFRITNTLSGEIAGLNAISVRKAKRRLLRYRNLYAGQKLIAVSEGVAEDLRDRIGVRSAQTITIYNPFDLDEIRRLSLVPDANLPSEPFIVPAGRFVPQKRHDLLLDAFKASKLPHRLVLMTKSSQRIRSLVAAKDLTDRVLITGFLPNPYPWYAKASAMILSSDFEGFPNVLVEALACGTPVVSTDCPSGPREIFTGPLRTYLSPTGDAEALGRNLASVVESPPALNSSIVRQFSRDQSLSAFEALARRGAGGSGDGSST
jgi:glycosyltransferase involved in cell wall biosynthesis